MWKCWAVLQLLTSCLEEFKAETKSMMLAMANGLGFLPVQMVLEEGSLLKKAVEREYTKLAD